MPHSRGAFNEIVPGLFQRGTILKWTARKKLTELHQRNIDVVANLWLKVDPDLSGMCYYNWPIKGDAVPERLDIILDTLTAEHEKGHTILVQCEAGRNRSAFICAMLLTRWSSLGGLAALAEVEAKVPGAKLNQHLRAHLEGIV